MIENKRIIISITSYPPRVFNIEKMLDSVFSQSLLPDKVVLYLVESDFINHEIPCFFEKYYGKGLEIHWCKENYKVHTKYFFAFQEFPNDLIITLDDDIVYSDTTVEELVSGYKLYPDCVIARRGHCILLDERNKIKPYNDWYWLGGGLEGVAAHSMFATGVGGVLYQARLLNKKIRTNIEFQKVSAYNDDIWLKYIEICSEYKVVIIKSSLNSDVVDSNEEKFGLNQQNVLNGRNDKQIQNVFYLPHAFSAWQKKVLSLLINEKKIYGDLLFNHLKESVNDWFFKVLECENGYIYIYGAGVVANRLKRVIDACNMPVHVKGFLVTSIEDNPREIDGIKVFALDNCIKVRKTVVIGVSINKQEEIFTLINRKLKQTKLYKLDTDILNAINLLDKLLPK